MARAIGDNGHVVGSCGLDETSVERAFVWTEAGGMRALGTLTASDAVNSGAFGVNSFGKAVGFSGTGSAFHAVIFPRLP
jgi:probable HAF family extracellular repeat protein